MLLINFFKKASDIIFLLNRRLLMLFFYGEKARLITVCFLLFFSSPARSQLNTGNIIVEQMNNIEILKNEISVSKKALQTYEVISAIFVSTLICCLFLVYKKQKQETPFHKKLEYQLHSETRRFRQFKENFTVINSFHHSLSNRLEVILQSIISIKNGLNKNQKKLAIEIGSIADFTDTSINHYNKTKELINSLE